MEVDRKGILLFTYSVICRQYFIEVCDVVDPETRFNIDQYTDVTRVTKPVIYISLAELNNTHKVCDGGALWLLPFVPIVTRSVESWWFFFFQIIALLVNSHAV